jgi:hypothetical protein
MPVLPDCPVSQHSLRSRDGSRAILNKNVQAFLDGERGVEDDESETEGENVVAGADLQEVANGTLWVMLS